MRISTLSLLPLLVLSLFTSASAQTMITCGDTFFDPGGENGNYPDEASVLYQVCPTIAGEVASITITQFEFETCCDGLTVYNGAGDNEFLAEVTGAGQMFTSTAPDGCLTLQFFSDGSVNEAGFTAMTMCTPPPTCPAPTNVQQVNRTETSLTFDWQGTASVYDVYLVEAGNPQPAAPTFEDVTSPFTFSSLTGDTEYDFYVRADCDAGGGSDESFIVGPTSATTLGPPPPNDECANAISIPLQMPGLCSFDDEYFDATATANLLPAAVCTDDDDIDLWYSFMPATTSVRIFVADNDPSGEGGGRDFEVFSGDCGALTSIGCEARPTNLTPNATYYIRVVSFSGGFGGPDAGYSICVQDQSPPPGNDDCEDPVALGISPTPSCLNPTAATTLGANEYAPANCGGTADDDVWFSFTATGPTHLLYLTDVENVAGTFGSDLYYEVYTGACGFLVQVVCDEFASFNDPPATLPGLTAGTEYRMRIYTDNSSSQVNFNICLATPPVNDECAGAIDVPVNPTAECNQFISSSTLGSTVSGSSCSSFDTNNGDVWFTFTATRETHLLRATNLSEVNGGRFFDLYFELTSGGCDAASQTVLECAALTSSFVVEAPNLTVGEEYHLRIWTRRFSTIVDFDLCIGSPPLNDDCDAAIVAPVNPDYTNTQTISGTTFGGTRSFEILASQTGCSRTANDDDVWYRFTALAEEHSVALLSLMPAGYDDRFDDERGIVRIYPAGPTCAAGDELDCDFLVNDADSTVFTGLTVGDDYFLSVQSSAFNNQVTFDLSIRTEPMVLPVELTAFTGRAAGKSNLLEWSVASEEAFSHYEIERSADGTSDWSVLGKMQGAAAGARSVGMNYSFNDVEPLTNNFYRLRNVDLDGTFAYSPIVHVRRAGVEGLTVYPNPSNGRFSVTIPVVDGPVEISVYDMAGRELGRAASAEGLPRLTPGVYQVVVDATNDRWRTRIVVK